MSNPVRTIQQVAPVVAPRLPDFFTSLDEIERVAKACAASGYYKDVKDVSQAIVKMLAGREMGMGPIAALAGIHLIEGRPTASANSIAANVKRSGRYDYRVRQRDNEACVLVWFENGQEVGTSSFTLDDAKRAGMAGKQNWAKFPRAMLFARALTEGVRVYCPDASGGVIYTPEELAPDVAVAEDGAPMLSIAPEPRVVNDPTPTPQPVANIDTVTEPQVKRMWAIAAKRASLLEGIHRNEIMRDALARFGYEHSQDVKKSEYESFCDAIQTWDVPISEPDMSADPEVF